MDTRKRLINLANSLEYKNITKLAAAREIDSIVKDIHKSVDIPVYTLKSDLVIWLIDNMDDMKHEEFCKLADIIKKVKQ